MKICNLKSLHYLFFCLLNIMPLFVTGMEDLNHTALLTDNEVSSGIAESLNKYIQEQFVLNAKPKTFQQSIELLEDLFGSFKFHKGRFAFNGKEIEIYNQQKNKWCILTDIGDNLFFYTWHNEAIGVICDSNKNIKQLISLARKQFYDPFNKNKQNYVELLKTLPQSISQRIQKRYVWSDLDEWVQEASEIQVETMKMSLAVPIKKDDTILDIKNWLENSEGIPLLHQNLCARWRGGFWQCWSMQRSYSLADDRYVREVMNTYNTNSFALWLRLRPQTNN